MLYFPVSYGRYGEPPAGSSQLHSMTVAAPGRVDHRLRQLSSPRATEWWPHMSAGLSCTPRYWLLLAAP